MGAHAPIRAGRCCAASGSFALLGLEKIDLRQFTFDGEGTIINDDFSVDPVLEEHRAYLVSWPRILPIRFWVEV